MLAAVPWDAMAELDVVLSKIWGASLPVPERRRLARFAVDAAMQLAIAGMSAVLAGLIVFQSEDGMINNFPTLGAVVVSLMILTIGLMFIIDRMAKKKNNATD